MQIPKVITRCRFCHVAIRLCNCGAHGGPHWQNEWERLGEGVTYCGAPDWRRQHEPEVVR